MRLNNRSWCIALAAVAGMNLAACNIYESGDGDSSSGYGYFRFVNLVAGSPDIELVMDDDSYSEIGFAEASSLDSLSTGTYDLEFNQILPNTENDNFIDDDDITIKSDYAYSYILYGEDPDDPEVLTITTDVDDLYDDDYEDGQGRLTFFQASSDLGDVDIYLVDEGDDLLNQTVYTSLSYMGESEAFDQDEDTYKIIVTESGTDTVLIEADNISIEEANTYVYGLVSYSVAGSDSLRYAVIEMDEDGARMVTNDAQSALVRINNSLANSDGLDVYMDDGAGKELVAEDLYFGDISYSFEMDGADDVMFYIYEAGADTDTEDALASDDFDIDDDSQETIIIAGDLDDDDTEMVDDEQDLTIIETHGKLIFVHAIEEESDESLEVYVVEEGGDPDNYSAAVTLDYMSSEEYEIEEGDYDIYVYREDDGDELVDYSLSDLEEGDVVNLTVTESQYGGSPYEIQEVLND